MESRGCLSITTDYLSQAASALYSCCQEINIQLGHLWTHTLQPILSNLSDRIIELWNALLQFANENPTAVAYSSLSFISGALSIIFINWCCCSSTRQQPETDLQQRRDRLFVESLELQNQVLRLQLTQPVRRS